MKVTCVVENTAGGSLWGEHGLSFFIETEEGSRVLFTLRVLRDTGQGGTVLLHNLAELKIDPREIQALALSHARQDHTGGLEALLERSSGFPLYAHPDLFRKRFSRHGEKVDYIGLPLTRGELAAQVELHLSREKMKIAPGDVASGLRAG
ncbi:MAG: MBL fold metallo-hydrolase [Chloroflexota bacterium]|nr:MBL fold metallo-hydrolase [Chloroflexota bacterium]